MHYYKGASKVELMKIRTTYWAKPIPDRQFDWSAIDDDTYDGAIDSGTRNEIGYGPTEKLAVEDLKSLLWDQIVGDEELSDTEVDRYCHKLDVEFDKIYEELEAKELGAR